MKPDRRIDFEGATWRVHPGFNEPVVESTSDNAWFTIIDSSTGAVTVVGPGTIGGGIPSNKTGLVAPASGTRFLVATITCSKTVSNNFVEAVSITSSSLSLDGSLPGSTGLKSSANPLSFKVAILTVVDRIVTGYQYNQSLTPAFIGTSTSDEAEIFV